MPSEHPSSPGRCPTLSAGTLILVRPGERVPLDGEVEAGSSALDESMLTGGWVGGWASKSGCGF